MKHARLPMSPSVRSEQDPEQFVRLFVDGQREVLRYILAFVPDLDDAHEILQETAVDLWKKFDQYDPSYPFAPWACRFAFHYVLKYRERKARQRRFLSVEALEQLAADRIEHNDLLEVRRHALARCVQRLSESERLLIQQRYAGEMNMAEVAKATGRNISTLYKALDRVRRRLFECVNRSVKLEGLL